MIEAEVRVALLQLGEKATHLLSGYIKIHDLKFDRTNFIEIYEAKLKRMESIKNEFDLLLKSLEKLADASVEHWPKIITSSMSAAEFKSKITNDQCKRKSEKQKARFPRVGRPGLYSSRFA